MRLFVLGGMARFSASIGNLVLPLVVAKFYSLDELGYFTLYLSTIILVSFFVRFGLDRVIIKYVSGFSNRKAGFLKFATLCFLVAVAAVFLFSLFFLRFLSNAIGGDEFYQYLYLGMNAVIPFSGIYLLASFLKGMSRSTVGLFVDTGVAGSLISILVVVLVYGASYVPTLLDLVLIYSASLWLVFIAVFLLFFSDIKSGYMAGTLKEFVEWPLALRTASVFMCIGLSQYAQQACVTFLTGSLVNVETVGLIRFAERLALFVPFPLLVINAIYSSRFSRLYIRKDYEALRREYLQSSVLSLISGGMISIAIYLGWDFIVGFYGEQYGAAKVFLVAFLLAQFFNVLTGPSDTFLGMTGAEGLLLRIAVISAVLLTVIFYLFARYGSIIHAVYFMLLIMIFRNLAQAYFARSRINELRVAC